MDILHRVVPRVHAHQKLVLRRMPRIRESLLQILKRLLLTMLAPFPQLRMNQVVLFAQVREDRSSDALEIRDGPGEPLVGVWAYGSGT